MQMIFVYLPIFSHNEAHIVQYHTIIDFFLLDITRYPPEDASIDQGDSQGQY